MWETKELNTCCHAGPPCASISTVELSFKNCDPIPRLLAGFDPSGVVHIASQLLKYARSRRHVTCVSLPVPWKLSKWSISPMNHPRPGRFPHFLYCTYWLKGLVMKVLWLHEVGVRAEAWKTLWSEWVFTATDWCFKGKLWSHQFRSPMITTLRCSCSDYPRGLAVCWDPVVIQLGMRCSQKPWRSPEDQSTTAKRSLRHYDDSSYCEHMRAIWNVFIKQPSEREAEPIVFNLILTGSLRLHAS